MFDDIIICKIFPQISITTVYGSWSSLQGQKKTRKYLPSRLLISPLWPLKKHHNNALYPHLKLLPLVLFHMRETLLGRMKKFNLESTWRLPKSGLTSWPQFQPSSHWASNLRQHRKQSSLSQTSNNKQPEPWNKCKGKCFLKGKRVSRCKLTRRWFLTFLINPILFPPPPPFGNE